MIKYVKGDLLEAEQNVIVHQCNAQDTMGSGVAKAIRDKYPVVYTDYVKSFKDIPKQERMGMVLGVQVGTERSVVICNLIAQYHYLPRGIRHTSYDALTKGFEEIKKHTKEDLAMPKIGCGLGGGNWRIVSAIIESVFDDRDVYIYELE